MNNNNIKKIARLLTEDPDIFNEAETPQQAALVATQAAQTATTQQTAKGLTDAQLQRKKLGLPHTGKQPALIYVNMRANALVSDPKEFAKILKGSTPPPTHQYTVNLSNAVSIDINKIKEYLASNPRDIINLIILPELDSKGRDLGKKGSSTLALDAKNINHFLPRLKRLNTIAVKPTAKAITKQPTQKATTSRDLPKTTSKQNRF